MLSQDQDSSNLKVQAGRWTAEQHQKFIAGIMKFGKDWKKVQQIVETRTGPQVRSHAQKFFLKLNKILKDRKKRKYKHIIDISETETTIVQSIDSDLITENTPSEILSLLHHNENPQIKCQKAKQTSPQNRFSKKINHQVQSAKKINSTQNKSLKMDEEDSQGLPNMKKLLQAYQNISEQMEEQDSSSFLKFLMNQNKGFFSSGHHFSDLIDFGSSKEKQGIQNNIQNLESRNQKRERKQSFTLLQQQQNEQKLLNTLGKFRHTINQQKIQDQEGKN